MFYFYFSCVSVVFKTLFVVIKYIFSPTLSFPISICLQLSRLKHPTVTQLFCDGYILLKYTVVTLIHHGSKYFDVMSKQQCVGLS